MDDSEVIIDSFDNFWFFSNIFSSKPQNLPSVGDVDTDHFDFQEPSCSNPIPIPVHKHNIYSFNTEILVQRSSNCGEFAAETEPQMAKTEPINVPEPLKSPKKEERRRKGRKKRGLKNGLDQRRRILGEIDLGEVMEFSDNNMGFDVNKVCYGSWMVKEKCGGSEKFGSQHHDIKKMPPLNDGLAMKEHLKSWAYAVACTVK